jgi:predicted Rossmann fold flavoprotein
MHILIIGGGASGFMAAITAAESFPNSQITILEKNKTVLNKVRISGGGRCNVTHQPSDARHFIKNYPRGEKFLRPLLNTFNAQSTIDWFAKRGVKLRLEADGRMFPESNSSHTIVECLLRCTKNLNIKVQTSTDVKHFSVIESENQRFFSVALNNEEKIQCDRLLIATGGYPKPSGFEWISAHAHEIVDPLPSLFTFNTPQSYLLSLAGVSVPKATVKISGTKHVWEGPLLVTHWGFSGPAVLKLSAWAARDLAEKNYHFECRINWAPEFNEEKVRLLFLQEKVKSPKQQISSHARFDLPLRLWKALVAQAGIPADLKWADASNKHLNKLNELITNATFAVAGKTTFKEEFVTCGGVVLSNINPQTLESKQIKGLFFSGEVLDVDGITGGFNFQNAWTTGYIVGNNIGNPLS